MGSDLVVAAAKKMKEFVQGFDLQMKGNVEIQKLSF